MSHNDLQMFSLLRKSEAYNRLQILWMKHVATIEAKRDSAAGRSQESAWRYYAGLEKGYKQAMLELDVEILRLEEEGDDPTKPSDTIEKLLSEVRGEINK